MLRNASYATLRRRFYFGDYMFPKTYTKVNLTIYFLINVDYIVVTVVTNRPILNKVYVALYCRPCSYGINNLSRSNACNITIIPLR